MIDRRSAQRAEIVLLISVALALAALYCAAFFPGTLPFDSAYQWWQARGGETSNVHGVGMTWLWRASDLFAESPAPMFLLQLALFWSGLVLIAAALPVGLIARLIWLLAMAIAPVGFVVLSSVVSDAMLIAVLTCAFGVALHARGENARPRRLIVLALALLALSLRKNALPALVPLVIYVVWLETRHWAPGWKQRSRILICSATVLALMQLCDALLERTVDRRVTVFATTALWDLAAISIDAGTVLLPPASHGVGLDVEDLRQAYVSYSDTPLFERTRAGMNLPFLEVDDPLNSAIREAWFGAVLDHPRAYLAHRWRVTRGLFGSKDAGWPRELVYFPANSQYRDNPPVAVNASALHACLIACFDWARSSWLLAPWLYLLFAALGALLAWRHRTTLPAQAALAVIASGLCYAAPLPIIAPSVELRYLGWTCMSSVIGLALALSASRDSPKPAQSLISGRSTAHYAVRDI